MKHWQAILVAAALSGCARAQESAPAGWQPIVVAAEQVRIAPGEGDGRFGSLVFRGGLVLKSQDAKFGGWSGLEIGKDGRIVAVSDDGAFFSARLKLDDKGWLQDIDEARLAPMRGLDGQTLESKTIRDAEDIVRMPDGRYAVSFEQQHRIWYFDLDGKGPDAGAVAGPPAPQAMSANEGMEALTLAPNGDLLAGREFSANRKPPTQIFRIPLDGKPFTEGAAEVTENYALTALRALPNGDYVGLNRFYFPILGVRIMLRRYTGSGLEQNPPLLAGPSIGAITTPLPVDNFEGLAVTRAPSGATRLYIISDDNFSASQRTLLLAFDLIEPATKPGEKKIAPASVKPPEAK